MRIVLMAWLAFLAYPLLAIAHCIWRFGPEPLRCSWRSLGLQALIGTSTLAVLGFRDSTTPGLFLYAAGTACLIGGEVRDLALGLHREERRSAGQAGREATAAVVGASMAFVLWPPLADASSMRFDGAADELILGAWGLVGMMCGAMLVRSMSGRRDSSR